MQGLGNRTIEGELMDAPGLPVDEHKWALAGLKRINRISGTTHVLWQEVKRLLSVDSDRPLTLLDVATGSGDVPIGLGRRARDGNLRLHVSGCDISDTAVECARQQAAEAQVDAKFFRLDLITDPIPNGYDIITCSLFLHHLQDEQIQHLIRNMVDAAGRIVLISDLIRDRLGLALAFVGTRVLTRSRIVHVDGLRSVRAALTINELSRLAGQAGATGFKIRRHWPRRMLFSWERS